MPHYSEDSGIISINSLDTRILAVLLHGPSNGYAVARQCEVDANKLITIATSNVYKALPRLEELMLISLYQQSTSDKGNGRLYRITSLGKLLLRQEVTALKTFTKIADDRLGN